MSSEIRYTRQQVLNCLEKCIASIKSNSFDLWGSSCFYSNGKAYLDTILSNIVWKLHDERVNKINPKNYEKIYGTLLYHLNSSLPGRRKDLHEILFNYVKEKK